MYNQNSLPTDASLYSSNTFFGQSCHVSGSSKPLHQGALGSQCSVCQVFQNLGNVNQSGYNCRGRTLSVKFLGHFARLGAIRDMYISCLPTPRMCIQVRYKKIASVSQHVVSWRLSYATAANALDTVGQTDQDQEWTARPCMCRSGPILGKSQEKGQSNLLGWPMAPN